MGLTYAQELALGTAVQSFWNTFHSIPDPFDGLVFRRPSTQKTDTYTRLGAAPMPEEWHADRNKKAANEYSFTAENVPYDSTVNVDKEFIVYQQWDEIATLASNQGMKARAHQTKLLSDLLVAGVSTVGDDGQFFFDDDHADPGAEYTTSQDNDLTSAAATGTVPTDLEARTAINAMFDKFWGFKDDRGDPFVPQDENPGNFVLMIPPEFRSIIRQLAVSDTVTGPLANELKGSFTYRVNPFFTGGNQMFLMYAGSNHKPCIIQESKSLSFESNIDANNNDMNMSAGWWGKVTYGQWRTAVSHIFS